ncbi:ABC transporter permease [Streptomyces otsuchiensis]|uniref:ABC transporter permease n=1 Tax=Streptomyces otsuchiensis TaxID=2681388 RepID=UPI00103129B1|nr:ABC transporter permease [Streptomyces otsuchiensis]
MGPRRQALVALVLIPVFAALALWAFSWPASRLAPNDLPIGVAGPADAADPVARLLNAEDGAFDVHRYPDAPTATTAIENRDIYGAFVVTPSGPSLLVASAASPLVAQLLTGIAEQQAPEGRTVPVTDVVPAPDADPRGTGFGAGVLPLGLVGIATGAALSLIGLRGVRLLAGLAGSAVVTGVVIAVLTHTWLGTLGGGDWLSVAAALALVILSIASAVAGLVALLGPPGIGIGALVVVLLGNPFSGATSAPAMLPDPVGTIGQWLPSGAGASLLRSVAFFDGAAAAFPLLVLVGWTVAGMAAAIAAGARRRSAPGPGDGGARAARQG